MIKNNKTFSFRRLILLVLFIILVSWLASLGDFSGGAVPASCIDTPEECKIGGVVFSNNPFVCDDAVTSAMMWAKEQGDNIGCG